SAGARPPTAWPGRSPSSATRASGSTPSTPRPSRPRLRPSSTPSAARVPPTTPGYDPGMTDITTSASVRIAAPPQRVWEQLTTPAEIKQWFFGVHTQPDWRVGSRRGHRGEYQGKPYEDSGEIIQIDPPHLL